MFIISRGGQIYKARLAQTVINIKANIDIFRVLDLSRSGTSGLTTTSFPFEFFGGVKLPTTDDYTGAAAIRYNVSSEKVRLQRN